MRKFIPLFLAGLALTSCLATPALFSGNTSSIQTQNALQRPERGVEQSRLEQYVSDLTGHKPLPNGQIIPERGSRQGRDMTRTYLTETLEQLGYKVERHEYRSNGTNIMTRLMADTPTDEYIIVGAHMDSVSNAGADDNSTGSAAVLEVARVMQQVKGRQVNLIFAWFDEEELGLIGSKYMARQFRKDGLKVLSVHTLDMVGYDRDEDNVIEIERPDGHLWAYYQQVNKTHGLNLPLERTNSGSTDHVAFRAEGFISVGLCEEWVNKDTTPYYHRKTDQYDTLNFTYLTNVTRLVSATLSDMVQKVPPPRFYGIVPHSRYPSRPRGFHQVYPNP